jgi:hypothetical protein
VEKGVDSEVGEARGTPKAMLAVQDGRGAPIANPLDIVPHARRVVPVLVVRHDLVTEDQEEGIREGKATADPLGVAVPYPEGWRTSRLGVHP